MANEELIDALKELINIGVGRAAATLSEMLEKPIKLSIPEIKLINLDDLTNKFDDYGEDELASVKLEFTGNINGQAGIVFSPQSALNLVSALTGEEIGSPDLDSVRSGTLSEVGNIVLNGIMGSVANIIKEHFNYTIPVYSEESILNLITKYGQETPSVLIVGKTRFSIEELEIVGDVLLMMGMPELDELMKVIKNI